MHQRPMMQSHFFVDPKHWHSMYPVGHTHSQTAELTRGSTLTQSCLPSLDFLFRTQMNRVGLQAAWWMNKGQMTVMCPWEDLGRIQVIKVTSLNTDKRFLNVLDSLSASCNLCVLSFSVFLRFTEMHRDFAGFTRSAVGIPWAHTPRQQCCVCPFGQMRHPSY